MNLFTDLIPARPRMLSPRRRDDFFSDYPRAMTRLMKDFFEDVGQTPALDWSETPGAFVPRLDYKEKDGEILVSAELPGLTDKDVEVMVDNDMLVIKGEKRQEKEEKTTRGYVSERRYGAFQRAFALPTKVDKDKISAAFDKGVLTIMIPKTPEAAKDVKKIPIKP